jgi:KUP system potassium uptake protein
LNRDEAERESGPEPAEEDSGGSLVADEPAPKPELEREHERRRRSRPTALLVLLALGVVYGDIGTSPIYAFRESLGGRHSLAPSSEHVLGILSLVVWALVLVVSVKYLFYILRAENDGEGGILALAALLDPWRPGARVGRRTLAFLGLFGAALLYGDGMITPAISVLSAVEGLEVAVPSLGRWVVPIAVGILLALFVFQRRGTGAVGKVFGPVMALWFAVLAALGVAGIARHPSVLVALDPRYAWRFLAHGGLQGYLVLGAVFLVVTGGEALYADLGHFGSRPIRLGWFTVVLPALVANYFGQGALLLAGGVHGGQPFYEMAPGWALYPLVGLATAATVIASQAVISGVFSLTRQAIHLGRSPSFRVEQTSQEDIGRIYLPAVNWTMMVATIGLVVGFGSSSALAGAYGVAVSTTFVITTVLASRVARERWGWSAWTVGLVTAGFLAVDLAFFGANLFKIAAGGWFPLAVAALVWFLMATWARGRDLLLRRRLHEGTRPVGELLGGLDSESPPRVPGTAVFLTHETEGVPPIVLFHLHHNQVLHETVVLLTVRTSNVPRVPFGDRLETRELEDGVSGLYRVVAHYGFMQKPNVPVLVDACRRAGLPLAEEARTTYYIGRRTPIAAEEFGMSSWRARIFGFLVRNAPHADASFNIPPEHTIELGIRLEI